jgi:hypothetical protein
MGAVYHEIAGGSKRTEDIFITVYDAISNLCMIQIF